MPISSRSSCTATDSPCTPEPARHRGWSRPQLSGGFRQHASSRLPVPAPVNDHEVIQLVVPRVPVQVVHIAPVTRRQVLLVTQAGRGRTSHCHRAVSRNSCRSRSIAASSTVSPCPKGAGSPLNTARYCHPSRYPSSVTVTSGRRENVRADPVVAHEPILVL